MNKFLLLILSLLLGCSSAPVVNPYQTRFESIPLGSTVQDVRNSFGQPNLFKDLSESQISFLSLLAYRTQGLFCIVYFEHGKTTQNGTCRKDDVKAEFTEDTSSQAGDFGAVEVRIKNTLHEPTCFDYNDMFNVTRKTCE
jgi:hypothetical protein